MMGFLVLAGSLLSSEIIHRKNQLKTNMKDTTDVPTKAIPIYIDTTTTIEDSSASSDSSYAIIEETYNPPSEEAEEVQEPTEDVEEEESEEDNTPALPVQPPVVSADPGDPLHPRVSTAASMPLKVIRSDARLSPLYMSYATEQFGWLRTLFSKYGFVGNRLTDPKKYTLPEAALTKDAVGPVDAWAYATLFTGSDCKEEIQSVAGIATHECIPMAGLGGERGQAIMMDCLSNGDVVMNAFNAPDCSGAPISSAVLAVTDTCYAYSYSLATDAVDSEYSTSVTFSCGVPDIPHYSIQKFFISTDDSAIDTCDNSDSRWLDGQIFEAFPVDTCVAQRQSDGNAFSLKFSLDDYSNPLVTYIFGNTVCGNEVNAKAKTASTVLHTDCESQAWQTGITSYDKWIYHEYTKTEEDELPKSKGGGGR